MYESQSTILRSLQVIFASIVMIAIVTVVSLILFSPAPKTAQAQGLEISRNNSILSVSDSPNIVTRGMARAGFAAVQSAKSANRTLTSTAQMVSTKTVKLTKTTGRILKSSTITAARGLGMGLLIAGRTVGSGIAFVFRIPGNAVRFISNTPVVHTFFRPADHVAVPIIDPNSPELQAALMALPATKLEAATATQTPAQQNSGPVWPIHGAITTYFGVNHWPYQKTHTGLDISDGQAPGVTPIRPFRPGRVVEKVISNSGLGNHVIVDHGNNVTSVYAHLNSISVNIGDDVFIGTALGYEGSTGLSTGTHLHFEIRVNGQAADPRQFIGGQP